MVELRYTLRPAEKTDFEFLYRLKAECLREYVEEIWGWDEAYQRQHFTRSFDPTRMQIIVCHDHDVGALSIEDKGFERYLAGFYIMPDWQNRGLGTTILQDVIERLRAPGIPVRLQVLKVNPARRLYERLGFEIYDESDTHYLMETNDPNFAT